MKLKTVLARLLREDTPQTDEESSAPETHASQESRSAGDSEKGRDETHSPDAGASPEEDLDLEPEGTQGPVQRTSHRRLTRVLSWVFPSPSTEEEIESYLPRYRQLPILSGIIIPFAILLDIPSLTEHWYIQRNGITTVASKPNPVLLNVGLAVGLFCAVLANLCLIMRFLERRIMMMTILCIVFLSIHDIISIVALVTFSTSKHGYTYSEAFWMTLCSTIASSFTNITLIIDFVRTPNFKRSGSGLTRRQRSLVIIIIGLLSYIGLGALINAFLVDLTFLNGLYFTVVTIETIGFGDIVPVTPASRVFICIYATLGIINIGFVVGYFRETVLEGINFGYRRRILAVQERRRAARRQKRVENRWRHAIVWRLRARHARVWIPEKSASDQPSFWSKLNFRFWRFMWRLRWRMGRPTHMTHCWHGMELNLKALPHSELEAAALETGAPLDTLLPPDFYESYDQDSPLQQSDLDVASSPWWFVRHPVYHHTAPVREPLTHLRLGTMAAMVTKVALAVSESGIDTSQARGSSDTERASFITRRELSISSSSGSLPSSTDETELGYRTVVAQTEKNAYVLRVTLSSVWFITFWMGGAAIFMATESWSYGASVYFCFIAFTTIGYGDLAPKTPAGRSIFIVWALVGVATMTILISVITEAYTSRYKDIFGGRNTFKEAVQKYRERTRVDLGEKTPGGVGVSAVRFHPQDTIHPGDEVTEVEGPSPSTPVEETTGAEPEAESTIEELDQAHSHAQESLEELPEHVLKEARSIQQYIRLLGDPEGHAVEVERYIDERIWNLMDEIMDTKALTEGSKMDILKESGARQTLLLLSLERSVQDIVTIAEQALAAVQERDRIIETLEQERDRDEAEGSAD